MSDDVLIEYIKDYFVYNSDGTITRLDRKNSNGSYDKDGYLILKIKGKQYKAHRIIYAMHHGVMPNKEIDHINRIRDDNRIENLRLVDRKTNVRNSLLKPNKNTGVVGVYIDKTKGLKKKYENIIENLKLDDKKTKVRNSLLKQNKNTGVVGVYIDKTNRLKKKYTTKLGGKTYRFYSLEDALMKRKEYFKGENINVK